MGGKCRMLDARPRGVEDGRQARGPHVPASHEDSSTMPPGPPAPDSEEQDEADRLEQQPAPAGSASASSGSSKIWDAPATVPRPPAGARPPGSSSCAATQEAHG